MKTTLALALSLGLASTTSLAGAQSGQPAEHAPQAQEVPTLHPADLNDDGHVTAEEFAKFQEDLFARADGNQDGRLDRDEVLALPDTMRGRNGQIPPAPGPEWRSGKRGKRDHARRNPEELFTTLDANDDGVLGRDEVPEGMARHFDQLDANGDDGVTLEELKQAKPDREAMRKRFEERFKSIDTNGDGLIQKSEATGRLNEKFDAIDTNADGAIDQAEIEQMRSKFRRHDRRGRENDNRHPHHRPGNPAPETAATPES